VETALPQRRGVKKMQSRAYQGLGTVTLESTPAFDNQKALRGRAAQGRRGAQQVAAEMDDRACLRSTLGLEAGF